MVDDDEEYDPGELAHWVAAPMKDVGSFEQFHEVVNRAEKIIRERDAMREVLVEASSALDTLCFSHARDDRDRGYAVQRKIDALVK